MSDLMLLLGGFFLGYFVRGLLDALEEWADNRREP